MIRLLPLLLLLTACTPAGQTVTADTLPEPADPSAGAEDLAYRLEQERLAQERALRSTTTHTHPPRPKPAPKPAVKREVQGSVWDELARCESGGNWQANTGNGFYGGLQFSLRSWRWVGGTGYPHEASVATQIEMAKRLLARQGWGAWPACSRRLGLR